MADDLIKDDRAVKTAAMERDVPDSAERITALDPSRSFIVQAPAGSGKTALLIQRFLKLLSYVARPEEVLAITFTRKAASEMHERIFESLLFAQSGFKGENENERRTLEYARAVLKRSAELDWGLLLNPARLQVQTIDSFCATLARRLPLMSKLGGNMSVTKDPVALYAEAARRTVRLIDGVGANAKAVRRVLLYHDNSIVEVEGKIVAMLEKREQWLRHTEKVSGIDEFQVESEGEFQADRLRLMLEGSVERLVEDELASLKAELLRVAGPSSAEFISEITRLARFAASNIDPLVYNTPIIELSELDGLPGTGSKGLRLWRAFVELFISQKNEWRKPRGVSAIIGFPADKNAEAISNKKSFKEVLEVLSASDELLKLFAGVRNLPDPEYTKEDWETLRALLQLLPAAVDILKDIFTEERTLDFTEISMAAIEALGPEDNPTDLMLSLDNTYSHILVDEYQDTSWTQVTLLNALVRGFTPEDGRTLFIVGDPMQSIYLFRDAEVGLFLEARLEGLEPVELVPLTLRSNFRSDGHIVDWVNGTFVNALPKIEDVVTGAVVYEESKAYWPVDSEATVAVRLFAGGKEVYGQQEANDIIEIVEGLNKTDSSSTKAVLFRSRSHLKNLVAGLKKEGIDFKAEALDPLTERASIQDLLALTRALFHPADRVAWLSVLRARWCGLTLSELLALCGKDSSSLVSDLIKDTDRRSKLDEEALQRLDRFRTVMDSALRFRGLLSPRRLIEGLWIGLNGPACYEGYDSVTDAELFFDTLESMSSGGELTSITALEESVEKLFATHSGEGENPLVLMTIHKAKGLEFDHVILPGLGRRARGTDKKLLYWMERGQDLILAPVEKKNGGADSRLFKYLVGVQKEKERLEAARLFYVAVTRAKKRLYLFGHTTKFEGGKVSVESSSLFHTIKSSLCPDMVVDLTTELFASDADEAETEVPVALKRLAVTWRTPEPVTTAGLPEKETERERDGGRLKYDWATVTASHVGTAVHSFFAMIANDGLKKWGGNRLKENRGRMTALLLGLGISKNEVKHVVDKGLALVASALEDESGRWVLGEQREAKTEWALSGLVGERVEEIVIDRTFVDEANVRWIIDYKTGRHEGSSIEEFIEGESDRYAPQLEKYETVLRGLGESREIKKALYYPALKRLVEL